MNRLFENDMNNERRNLNNDSFDNESNLTDNDMVNETMRSDTDTANNKVLVGIFETEDEAINVIRRLKETGYQESEITVVAKDKEKMEHIDDTMNVDTKTQEADGKAAAGAGIGAVVGGLAAALPALGLLVIPGIGPILAAGPIAVILGGAVAGGVAGGLIGVLADLGVDKEDAKEYETHIDQGKILVLVENREHMREDVHATFNENNSIINDRSWQNR